ncbi:MAG: ABC transporter permease subunit [Candidatus Natronoplasma sp.]
MVRWDDLKADVKEVFAEFKKHKIGWIGVSLIGFMVILGLLAPVFAPGVHQEWSRAHERWQANPRNAPPVWYDWITSDDHARHTVVEEWENYPDETDSKFIRYEEGEASFDRDLRFDELGNRTFEVRNAEGDVLEEHTVLIEPGEGIENINVSNLEVDPTEGDSPLTIEVSADITHNQEVEENRTVPLEINGDKKDEWEMTYEGDNVTQEISETYTLAADDYYFINLGEGEAVDFVKVGAGMDVIVEDFGIRVDEQNLTADMDAAAVENLVEEERNINFRIDFIEENDEGEIISRDTIEREDWPLEGFERIEDITGEYTLPEEGQYEFIFGSEVIEREVVEADEDEENPETTSFTAESFEEDEVESQSDGEDELSEEDGLQQQDDVEIEIDAPDEVTIGDLDNIELDIKNKEEVEQELYLHMSHEQEGEGEPEDEIILQMFVPRSGRLSRFYHTFTFDYQADIPPQEIFMNFMGEADGYYNRRIVLERPDGTSITLEDIDRGVKIGEFHETVTTVRRINIMENVHSQIANYLETEHDIPRGEMRDPYNVDLPRVLFGERSEDWMDYPEPLNGQYNLTIALDGVGLEMAETSEVTFSGAVYGLMGTDSGRRDIFQGWVWGARYGLIAGGLVALTTILFGTTFGMTSAYYGGWVDEFMQRLNEILMGIPTLPILIIVLQFWQRSIWVFVMIYALLMWRGAAKVIRSRGLQVAKDTYIEAAESLGSGSGRIIAKHMIPQILPYAIAQAALLVPIVIMAEAGLHILGLGDPNIVTWGTLLNEARSSGAVYNWQESWFWILFPGIGMMLVGFGFISTGMAIERIINPKMKQR